MIWGGWTYWSILLMLIALNSGCLTSILRLRSLYLLSISTDLTYDNLDAAIWSCVEVNVGLLCACVPTLKPLISGLIPRLFSEHNSLSKRSAPRAAGGYAGGGYSGGDIALSSKAQGHRAYAQFDHEAQDNVPENGKVKVTVITEVLQEEHMDDSSDASTRRLRIHN